MNLRIDLDGPQYPARVRWVMGIAWMLIAIKCVVVWWAIEHWQMPFHPLWIIAPTLAFGGLATILWLTHQEE
jgi:hypothetical protein